MKHTKITKKLAPVKEVSAEKTTKPAEKVFDITHPGKSMPSASARPIIVSHKPNVSDPMVSPTSQRPKDEETSEESTAGEGAEIIMAAPKKNRIEPLHTDVTPDEDKIEVPDNSDESTSPEEAEPQNKEQVEATEANDATTEETSEVSEAAAEATAKKEAQAKASKQEAEASKRQAEVEALINNKQFFVPINAVQKRRSKEVILALVVLIVALVSLLAALDAGLLDIGITPPTDFIQDKQ